MKKSLRLLLPLAAAAVPVAMVMAPMATAQADTNEQFGATLNPLNHSTGSGMLTISLHGSTATINEHVTGLATTFSGAPYPHVQHIHIGAQGTCPTPSADKNNDGVVNTTEGGPSYGAIGTTLSLKGDTSPKAGTNIKVAPGGGSFDYSRTIELDSATLDSIHGGTGVIVVHGLDPATLSKKAQGEKSDLVPSLPLAATSPALCGALTSMPTSGPATGTGSTAGPENLGLAAVGGGLFALAGGTMLLRRRLDARVETKS
jgi:hypothetical protein